jgi:hypothetical protein
MFVEATVRAYHQLPPRPVGRSSPCCPHPSKSSSVNNPLPQADLGPPRTDQAKDVLGHVDYLYSLDSADRELYQVSFGKGPASLLLIVDFDIGYFDGVG